MPLLERDVAKQCTDFLRARGWRIVRTQFAFSPGSFATGEPGMCDVVALRYEPPGRALVLWCEWKGPNDQRRCTCQPGSKKVCKVCRQKAWQDRERALGASVVQVSDFEAFAADYERAYGFLHTGDTARGQLELGITAAGRIVED